MPRIIGVDIPSNKKIVIALTYIYGIGPKLSADILKTVNIDPEVRAKDVSDEDLSRLASEIQKNYVVEGPLHRQIRQNIQRLKDIQCYRGIRHRRGLPVRGQRTQSNSRTRKGPKKTVAGKKKAVKG
ncbi:MAG: 30S ribosomal protein S13 [Candidatus Brocadiae bacterium]|nr:30S ribosomal protein S13 [Candidatus Brocadiia bacterium]